MGRAARRKRGHGNDVDYRVRSGAEVWAKFGARHAAIVAAMQEAHLQRGAPSFDAQREQQLAEGAVTIHDDGSKTLVASPELRELVKLRVEMFAFKFGREIGPRDLIFFDVDADTPQPEPTDPDTVIATLRAAAQEGGVDLDRAVEHFLGSEELAEYRHRRQS